MFVEVKDLSFKYKNSKRETIKNFNIEIQKGETVGILGESGSGKSTILRLIAGLEENVKGTIIIDGKAILDRDTFLPPEKRGLGMVFQDYALFPHMTVEENIKFGLKKMKREEKNNRVQEMLKLIDLQGFEKRYPYELSGGQQQRVAIGRAVAPKPSILLLDEPFSNLDANLQGKIRGELKDIINKIGITSIFVTHDKEDALAIADKVIILKDGNIIAFGDPKEVI
ncbi:ABC transporter ATP-binding protein [Hathewaya histolytica]|uniref:ABC-type quaternary amine transporter n=1 Tax=Hathewaya histolytica TaxID=1498 RepID=A0A4U9R6P5_HATHI|nr:ABC transporter ATP-binding protein [Hathewaya histolytica]VTQ84370.1 ABC transporter [Hathewaya histolytica]